MVNVTLLTLHVVEDLIVLRMTRCAGRPGPRRTAKRLFHSTGGLSGDREQRFLGVLSAVTGVCPREANLFPDSKAGATTF